MKVQVKSLLRNSIPLLLFSLVIIFAGYLILTTLHLSLFLTDFLILSALFTFIILISVIIFRRGESREPRSQTMHTFVSLSLKFLLELVLTLIWFILAKKTSSGSVLMFFVLYLAFSLFLILNILKTLKNKSL